MTACTTSENYQKQLNEKVNRLQELLAPFAAPALEVFPSAETHYRMRAEFRVWHDGDDLYHIMFDPQTKEKYRVDTFPPASHTINAMMAKLLPLLKTSEVMRKKLFQIDYLTGLSGEIVVSLLYHKPLNEKWLKAAEELVEALRESFNVSVIGRARKQKCVIGNDFIIERLPVNGKEYLFKHIENSFTQPNAEVNCKMIEWALSVCPPSKKDLLELYCGAGNFSLPLASRFRQAIGTEIAKPSVSAAQFNIEINKTENLKIVRLSAEEFTEAMVTGRSFTRLHDIVLADYDFSTVLVDPPRAGLDAESLSMIQAYEEIIYISCNPETLRDNLNVLCKTHDIQATALFDQFPFTHHIEAGVKLVRKKG
ncbi:tRNA (uridine(54)-C5)-methyltransferase TrmA [Alteromonas pelagimontana]|uniref:tRNA/tmRNA (uracil-C(5))-methyltransferase n=1 Tax=Alteromonas pelagimontana TaxID=1858656 RepID=A0A6M4MG86_9ALTE|nr:tRNA (uridine(54)-C5)-methyltransferase TrmA [Alteromonas pelagimontana]QJR81625.1 tRNA (uridine(54)-C5)-methyltransferase TrmA [Alteromonas pelagimontana]